MTLVELKRELNALKRLCCAYECAQHMGVRKVLKREIAVRVHSLYRKLQTGEKNG